MRAKAKAKTSENYTNTQRSLDLTFLFVIFLTIKLFTNYHLTLLNFASDSFLTVYLEEMKLTELKYRHVVHLLDPYWFKGIFKLRAIISAYEVGRATCELHGIS